jgi:hypothetical protein
MTQFEKEQLQYKDIAKAGELSQTVIKDKSYNIKVKDNKEWIDYTVEFTIDKLYTSMGSMVAFDVEVKSITSEYSKKSVPVDVFKKQERLAFNRITSKMVEDFNNKMKSDSLFKVVFYNVNYLHLNKVIS